MAQRRSKGASAIVAGIDQPLIGVVVEEDDNFMMHYFVDEDDAEAVSTPQSRQTALDLAGAWSDLDWDEVESALSRIRQESRPSPPLELDDE